VSLKINKLLAGLFVLALGLLVVDKSAPIASAYNTYMATLFPGDIAVNGDIKVIGNDLLDSGETTRITLGSTNAITGNATVSGNVTLGDAATDVITFTGLPALPSDAAPRTNLTPGTTFQMVVNTGSSPDQVCISTGVLVSQWALLSNFSTACSN
jgi:hypothetical protein